MQARTPHPLSAQTEFEPPSPRHSSLLVQSGVSTQCDTRRSSMQRLPWAGEHSSSLEQRGSAAAPAGSIAPGQKPLARSDASASSSAPSAASVRCALSTTRASSVVLASMLGVASSPQAVSAIVVERIYGMRTGPLTQSGTPKQRTSGLLQCACHLRPIRRSMLPRRRVRAAGTLSRCEEPRPRSRS